MRTRDVVVPLLGLLILSLLLVVLALVAEGRQSRREIGSLRRTVVELGARVALAERLHPEMKGFYVAVPEVKVRERNVPITGDGDRSEAPAPIGSVGVGGGLRHGLVSVTPAP